MADFIEVRTTVERNEDAERITRALVHQHLAACVQVVGPIRSTYWWKGEVETADEFLILAKTRASLWSDVERAIRSVHPYETPEIAATTFACISDDYERWLDAEIRKP